MKKTFIALAALVIVSCNSSSQSKGYTVKAELPKQLKEISGLASQGNYLWAISDRPHPVFFKLNDKGQVLQQVRLANTTVSDVEAITADNNYVYIGDVGDNEGNRAERQVIKVAMSAITSGAAAEVAGEAINFTFPDEVMTDKKKLNDFDCEALMSFNDSLYLFTKRRTDDQSELYVIPKTPGTHIARFIAAYNTGGLVTDAAINNLKTEVALTGYEKGHKNPFILLFRDFKGNNFFSGSPERIELNATKTDWQVEGITYKNDNVLYFSCEQTKDVAATLYSAERSKLANGSSTK